MCEQCAIPAAKAAFSSSRRRFLGSLVATGASLPLASLPLVGVAWAKELKAPPKPQNVVSPDAALELLKKGNERFVEGVAKRHDFKRELASLVAGQNPYAGVLTCADSRIAPEYAFDSSLGDLFVCRVAGNFANDDVIASFEYAVAHLAVPLIFVLGHESCGAVEATLQALKDNAPPPGHLPSLVASLTPAAKAGAAQPGDPLANAIKQNVTDTVAKLKAASPILDAAVGGGKLKIVGGVYRLADGKIDVTA